MKRKTNKDRREGKVLSQEEDGDFELIEPKPGEGRGVPEITALF